MCFIGAMLHASRSLRSTAVLTLTALSSAAFVVVACSSAPKSSFEDDAGGGALGGFDGSLSNAKPDSGDLYANDPPPKYCVLAGQSTPPMPTGTEGCPSDKNKPGCACSTLGDEAACWTGLRINRNLGQCKDGKTKCVLLGENTKGWGPCEGEVLPSVGQTGKAACKCFSAGQWKIANNSPCFINYGAGGRHAVSTVEGKGCPDVPNTPPPTKPTSDWSTNTLTVDCAGRFELCFELKAGNVKDPKPTDCSLAKVCVKGDYPKENVEQDFPPLPAWVGSSSACAEQFSTTGGYGEMSVLGESVLCDKVDDGAGKPRVFQRNGYCPSKCSNGANPNDPECKNCAAGGSGQF